MNLTPLDALITTWTHGTRGFLLAYGMIGVFMIAGLKQGGARARLYFALPILALPTLVVVGLSIEAILWALERFGHIAFGRNAILPALILYMVGGFFGGLYWARRGGAREAVSERGAMVIDGTAAQRAGTKQRAKALKAPDAQFPLTLAGVTVPFADEFKHFKIMGVTGSGKSTALRGLVHAALYRGDRAVIADPDGGYLSRLYDPKRGDVILNPFDARSAKWNLFGELRNTYDIDQLARAMIPDRANADAQWTSYARTFFSAVTRQAKAAGIDDVGELYRLLTSGSREELKLLVASTPAAPFLEDGSEKMFGGVRSTTADAVRGLDYIRECKGRDFSVREWIRSGKGVLFMPYQADQIAALKALISTWMRLAISQNLSLGEGDWRLWYLVDELDALGAIDGLADALPRMRKFGGRCALGFQSIGMTTTLYGKGPAEAMVENAGNSLILRCSAAESGGTARFASTLIGSREVTRATRSVSRSGGGIFAHGNETVSEGEHQAMEPAVLPAQIEQLPDCAGYLKLASQPAWMQVQFPLYEIPKVAEAFVPVSSG